MKGILRRRRYFPRHEWKELLLPTWQVGLALVAILDIINCWSIIYYAWMISGGQETEDMDATTATTKINESGLLENASNLGNDTCNATKNNDTIHLLHNSTLLPPLFIYLSSLPCFLVDHIGPIFCLLCIINGVIRARRAQQLAYENAALDVFETKLASLCTSARSSFRGLNEGASQEQQLLQADLDHELAHKTLRIWGPVIAQLTLWFVLIPWASFTVWTSRYFENIVIYNQHHERDSALLTIWLTRMVSSLRITLRTLETQAWTLFWKRVRHFALRSPIKLYLKFRQVFRWIRFVRYAGPLLRMFDKVQNHTRDLIHTWRQSRAARTTKLNRIQCRDSLQQDIQRIASRERMNRALRAMKSQVFKRVPSHYQNLLQRSVGETLAMEKKKRAKIQKKVETLSEDANKSWANLSEVYDQLVDLTQEVTSSVRKEVLSSHLIPPNTRFSVAWRVIVSGSLLLELLRLWASWRANGDYTVPLAELLKQWFVTCDPTSSMPLAGTTQQNSSKQHQLHPDKVRDFLVASGRFLTFGKLNLFDKNNKLLIKQCYDASYSASLAQQIGVLVGNAIDIVCFLDIFVWFYTGQLDIHGNVVPKPFFSRCIVPGTLVQVFDHPTLPTVLPSLFLRLFRVAEAVGFARVIRWGLVLEPAFNLLVLDPAKAYWLSPAADDEYGVYSTGQNMDDLNSTGSLRLLGKHISASNGSAVGLAKSKDSMIFNRSLVY